MEMLQTDGLAKRCLVNVRRAWMSKETPQTSRKQVPIGSAQLWRSDRARSTENIMNN